MCSGSADTEHFLPDRLPAILLPAQRSSCGGTMVRTIIGPPPELTADRRLESEREVCECDEGRAARTKCSRWHKVVFTCAHRINREPGAPQEEACSDKARSPARENTEFFYSSPKSRLIKPASSRQMETWWICRSEWAERWRCSVSYLPL